MVVPRSKTEKFRQSIFDYFNRMAVLRTQIPENLRMILLRKYMLWDKFESDIHVDSNGNLGFEIYRQSETALQIRIHDIDERIEKTLFLACGKMLKGIAINVTMIAGKFVELSFINGTKDNAPIFINRPSDIRIIDCSFELLRPPKQKRVKKIHFSWIVHESLIDRIQPVHYAQIDFYDQLFTILTKVIEGQEEGTTPEVRKQLIVFYESFLEGIVREFQEALALTESNELVFQKLLNNYKFFLDPDAKQIKSQDSLVGQSMKRKPDFKIELMSKVVYVEIEPPYYKPFEGPIPSARLRGALKQISDWKQIGAEVPEAIGSQNIEYLIIIGLAEHLSDEETTSLKAFNSSQADLRVVTWDLILDNIEKVKLDLENSTPEWIVRELPPPNTGVKQIKLEPLQDKFSRGGSVTSSIQTFGYSSKDVIAIKLFDPTGKLLCQETINGAHSRVTRLCKPGDLPSNAPSGTWKVAAIDSDGKTSSEYEFQLEPKE
jgi:hypothetical protein